jgi:hypothetical protein
MAAELDVAHGAVGLWESGARPVPGPVLRLLTLYEQDLGLSSAAHGTGARPLEALSVSRLARNAKLSRTAAGIAARATVLAFERMFVDRERARVLSAGAHAAIAARMAEALGEMKGLAMKIGQSASYLDFAIPQEARAALASLCARSRPMAPSVVVDVFLRELGKSPRQLFAEWSPQPFAAASIGQVHRARLKSGELVAVKVQYPRIAEAIDADLRNALLAERASALIFRGLDAGVFTAELRERFLEECDYRQEAANQRELGALWSGHDDVFIPRVFDELTTSHILTTELGPCVAKREGPRRRPHLPLRLRIHLPPWPLQRRPEPRQLPVLRTGRDVPRFRLRETIPRRAPRPMERGRPRDPRA